MINKKGQLGIIQLIFLLAIFVIIWFIWLGGWINQVGQMANKELKKMYKGKMKGQMI